MWQGHCGCKRNSACDGREYITKAAANSVEDLYWIDQAQLAALEPEVVGVGGVVSPSTGIVDSHGFMLSLQGDIEAHGGMLALGCAVRAIESGADGNVVHTDDFLWQRIG